MFPLLGSWFCCALWEQGHVNLPLLITENYGGPSDALQTRWECDADLALDVTENRADVNSLAERLYYENVIRELGDSSEIIYLSVANAALAHLPYLIALDHQSRHVPSLKSLRPSPYCSALMHCPESSLSYTQKARR